MAEFAASRDRFQRLSIIDIHAKGLVEYKGGEVLNQLAGIRNSSYPGRGALPNTSIYEDTEELLSV